MLNGKEYILCSAIVYKEKGTIITIICGHRHSDCYATLMGLKNGIVDSENMPDRDAQGFLTSKNRFVGRKEAYTIAKANNQLLLAPKENDEEEILTSEDLY